MSIAHAGRSDKGLCIVEQYARDVVLRRVGLKQQGGGVRGKQEGLTRPVLRRMSFAVHNARVDWVASVCLTYPGEWPRDGRVVKRHLNRFLIEVGRMGVGGLRYVWFMEFQARGAPHFHILFDLWVPQEWLARRWYAIVGSGDPRHLESGTQVQGVHSDGLRWYFTKTYLAKVDRQKVVPEGFENPGSLWGMSRGLVEMEEQEPVTDGQAVLIARQLRKSAERPGAKRRRRRMPHKDKGFRGFTGFARAAISGRLIEWARGECPGDPGG